METSICNNCVNDSTCTYQTTSFDESKIFCEAYEVEQRVIIPEQTNGFNAAEAIKDLCSNCDHKTDCNLRSAEHFIFQCEHYI